MSNRAKAGIASGRGACPGAWARSSCSGAATRATSRSSATSSIPSRRPARCPGSSRPRSLLIDRPAVAVKIENSSIAYPLKGLESAEIVYEELVEGGITRFLAMYHCTDAELAGPDPQRPRRGSRDHDPDHLHPCVLGREPTTCSAVSTRPGIVQIEENAAGEAMQRVETGDSFEHTLFANTAAVRKLGRKQYAEPPPEDVYVFGELPDGKFKKANEITITFSGSTVVSYKFDTGRYYRYQAGEPFMADTGRADRGRQRAASNSTQ